MIFLSGNLKNIFSAGLNLNWTYLSISITVFHFGELTYEFTLSSLVVSECYQFKLFTFLSKDSPLVELRLGKSFISSERDCMMLLSVVKWNCSWQIQTSLPFLTHLGHAMYAVMNTRRITLLKPLQVQDHPFTHYEMI